MRRRRSAATRNVILFASAVLCLAGLIAFVGTRKPTLIMPPETQEELVMRRSADNAYFTLMEAVKLLPKNKPLALPVPDAEYPALQVAYRPKSGSLGEILDIKRPDDDPELIAYLEQCGPAIDKTREAFAKPYYRLPIIWSEYRLLDFRNSWMDRGEAAFRFLGSAMVARAVQAVRAGGDGAQTVATLLDVVRLGQLMATDGTIEDTRGVQQHAVWWIGEAASSLNRESLTLALKETLRLESKCDVSVSSLEHHWRILDNTQSLKTRFSGVTDITERIHFGIQLRNVRKLLSEHRDEFRQAVLMDASQFKDWFGAHSEWRHKAYPMICP
ncbi:MAG: hypothetical protein HZB26_14135, partial [Candidatus Hydrogenedentes bacterium]|nr:hypothetical protein [Candidatus Hydrogenedentota bacterium]